MADSFPGKAITSIWYPCFHFLVWSCLLLFCVWIRLIAAMPLLLEIVHHRSAGRIEEHCGTWAAKTTWSLDCVLFTARMCPDCATMKLYMINYEYYSHHSTSWNCQKKCSALPCCSMFPIVPLFMSVLRWPVQVTPAIVESSRDPIETEHGDIWRPMCWGACAVSPDVRCRTADFERLPSEEKRRGSNNWNDVAICGLMWMVVWFEGSLLVWQGSILVQRWSLAIQPMNISTFNQSHWLIVLSCLAVTWGLVRCFQSFVPFPASASSTSWQHLGYGSHRCHRRWVMMLAGSIQTYASADSSVCVFFSALSWEND